MPGAIDTLQSQRLGMRRFMAEDVEPLRPVFADCEARRCCPAMGQAHGLQWWIAWNLKNYQDFGLWAVELLESGVFIGDARLTYQTVEGERILEIGWHIHPDFRSWGYATEAGAACLKYGFDTLGAAFIGSVVDPANMASRKVAGTVHAQQREVAAKGGAMLLYSTTGSQFRAGEQPSG